MSKRIRSPRALATGFALLTVLSACSADTNPTALDSEPVFQIVEQDPAQVWICKIGPEGTTADFEVVADGPGELLLGETFTLEAYPECVFGVNAFYFWQAVGPRTEPLANTTLTVTEVGASAGMELAMIDYAQYLGSVYSYAYPPENSASIVVNYDFGGRFKFVNEGEPPSGGGEGCTPGYWRQPQHFDSYPAPYTFDMLFSDAFGAGFDGMTLAEVAELAGGGLEALGRHAVAALLNSANAEVDYDLSTSEVIDGFLAALESGDYEGQKDIFEGYNEQGCDLD